MRPAVAVAWCLLTTCLVAGCARMSPSITPVRLPGALSVASSVHS